MFKQQPLKQSEFFMKIIEDLGQTTANENTTRISRYAIFECSVCLQPFKARAVGATARKQKSCGPCTKNINQTCKHPLYPIWNGIRQRCYNPKRKDYARYGAIGVTMHETWKNDAQAFIDFCLQNGWTSDLVIDKDIKCRELGIYPAIYSPDTLSFISVQSNAEEANAKAVLQFSLQGELLNEYPSCTKAALALGKTKAFKSAIANCCRGLNKTSLGFIWKYK